MREDKRKSVLVVGGGAAGMMAAWTAAAAGACVHLYEKNIRLGRKLLITGKGRCNLTNAVSVADVVKNIPGNGQFLYSALSRMGPAELMAIFNDGGVPLKVERGQRVFPESDRSADVVTLLERHLRRAGAQVYFKADVEDLWLEDHMLKGLVISGVKTPGDAVILATGGMSYPLTGSTGDGYRFAEAAGHHIAPLFPSLVPLVSEGEDCKQLEGLSLRNVEVSLWQGEKRLAQEFGELVFTDFGLSGPVILTLSRFCGLHFAQSREPLHLMINLKAALSEEQLDARLLRDLDRFSRRNYQTLLEGYLPKKLIPVFVRRSGIDPWQKVHAIDRKQRKAILSLLRSFSFTVTACRPIAEAIITGGGVDVKEVNPKTMASKRLPGLFLAGELLDIDGYTGGFNLQAAFATGYQAGKGAAAYCCGGKL